MLKAGQTIELELESLACEGDAVGHHEGQAVFVPFGAPGDRVAATISDARKTYCRAAISGIIRPSDERVEPRCPLFGACGGCQWQMLSYQAQLRQKQRILTDTLARIGGITPPVITVIPDATGWHYRNKAQFPVTGPAGKLAAGYYRRGSHDIVAVGQCPIADERINRAWPRLVEILQRSGLSGYREADHQGVLRHAVLRVSKKTGTLSLTLVTATEPDLGRLAVAIGSGIPEITSVWQNVNPDRGNTILGGAWRHLAGDEHVAEEIGGFEFSLSPGAFLQVNLPQAEAAYRAMVGALRVIGTEHALDLFCGVGAIAFHLARTAAHVTGIESAKRAVADASVSAARNGIANCTFRAGMAEREVATDGAADVIALDPPRKGADPALWPEVARLAPRAVAYLSCNPATFARDARLLSGVGYRLDKWWMIDLFPQTHHVESLGIFERS